MSGAATGHRTPRRPTRLSQSWQATYVNRLLSILQRDPTVVTAAARQDRATFGWLLDALGDRLLSQEERATLAATGDAAAALDDGYLPVISGEEWETVLRVSRQESAHNGGWWTVMVSGDAGMGLTVPEDRSGEDVISVFVGPPKQALPISWRVATSTVLVTRAGSHCPAVTKNGCNPGICGRCVSRKVYSRRTGYGVECWCDDGVR